MQTPWWFFRLLILFLLLLATIVIGHNEKDGEVDKRMKKHVRKIEIKRKFDLLD
jgi:hypothetical protein